MDARVRTQGKQHEQFGPLSGSLTTPHYQVELASREISAKVSNLYVKFTTPASLRTWPQTAHVHLSYTGSVIFCLKFSLPQGIPGDSAFIRYTCLMIFQR
jgi:hypothetical protein